MQTLLVANWKMNLGAADSFKLASEISKKTETLKQTSVWLAPSYTSIPSTQKACKNSPCKCGAQNIHWSDAGAYTGEISGSMLKEEGVEFVIIGHSERRHIFYEPDQDILRRAEAGLRHGMTIIFCVGETLEEKESQQTTLVLKRQLAGLNSLQKTYPQRNIIIAYEPVWAIGSGKVASITEIIDAHSFIRDNTAAEVPILYGGSVAPDNFEEILAQELVFGALVGGASLSFEKFSALIDIAEKQQIRN